jgi:hypothetical protein
VGDETAALDHAFGDWSRTDPTVETRTCDTSGETETRDAVPVFDQDGDGEVTESDAQLILSILVSGERANDLKYDIDLDGVLTVYDAVLILQQIG